MNFSTGTAILVRSVTNDGECAVKKGRHRRYEEARALKRGADLDIVDLFTDLESEHSSAESAAPDTDTTDSGATESAAAESNGIEPADATVDEDDESDEHAELVQDESEAL